MRVHSRVETMDLANTHFLPTTSPVEQSHHAKKLTSGRADLADRAGGGGDAGDKGSSGDKELHPLAIFLFLIAIKASTNAQSSLK